MLISPASLQNDWKCLEDIEKASLRFVVQAVFDFRQEAVDIFRHESDLAGDIGEDITREALDRIGVSKINQRLFGKIDYKKARYLFLPGYAVKQALFVDSKAEKEDGKGTATLQMPQTSMEIRQIRSGENIRYQGELPCILGNEFLTTTIFVKYTYTEKQTENSLNSITIAALPNGFLQNKYNPSENDTIFKAGRNAPSRGEAFRVRLSFDLLKKKANWRVQNFNPTEQNLIWED